MNPTQSVAALAAAFLLLTITPAVAKPQLTDKQIVSADVQDLSARKKAKRKSSRMRIAAVADSAAMTASERMEAYTKGEASEASPFSSRQSYARAERSDVRFIPNPAGTWRVVKSCAHRLAAYWKLGPGLDAVSTWPKRFARAQGPCIGCAAIRPGHIMGIIGGSDGAWRVADFNSGDHLNREYTVANFRGYSFVNTNSKKYAENE